MKKAVFVLVICAVLAVVLGSCTSFQVSGLTIPATASTAKSLGEFAIDVKVTKFLGSAGGSTLGNIMSDASDVAIISAVKAEITRLGGTSAVNVKIVYGATIIDLILNSVTGYIYAPANAHVTGTVIK